MCLRRHGCVRGIACLKSGLQEGQTDGVRCRATKRRKKDTSSLRIQLDRLDSLLDNLGSRSDRQGSDERFWERWDEDTAQDESGQVETDNIVTALSDLAISPLNGPMVRASMAPPLVEEVSCRGSSKIADASECRQRAGCHRREISTFSEKSTNRNSRMLPTTQLRSSDVHRNLPFSKISSPSFLQKSKRRLPSEFS